MIHGLDFFICFRADVVKNNKSLSMFSTLIKHGFLPTRVCLWSYLLYIINCYIEGLWREGACAKQLHSGHLIGCGKMENYAEIFGNIMRKKLTIMRKRRQIMRKFLTSYPEFNSFMTCLTFCCHSWTGIFSFNAVFSKFFL